MVGYGCGLAAGMHCPLGGAHVDPFEFYLGGKDVAQGGASGGVAVVAEASER